MLSQLAEGTGEELLEELEGDLFVPSCHGLIWGG